MYKLSIIIPAFNAKDTIIKTLESIAIQIINYPFEVVIVNDKSDYSYEELIDRFSKFYSIREIALEKNCGPGVARKLGIENTKGDYITFIDADDCLYSPYSLTMMLDNITEKDADLLISNFICERDGERVIKKKNKVWLHGKMYKRKFLEINEITFNDTRANEDNGFNRLILLCGAKIQYLDKVTYVYQENSNSITRKNNRRYKFDGLEWYAYNMNWAMDKAISKGRDRKTIELLALNVLTSMYFYYMDLFNEYDVQMILKWSKKMYNDYYKNSNIIEKYMYDSINDSRKTCLSKEIKEFITFEEFIERVDKYNG